MFKHNLVRQIRSHSNYIMVQLVEYLLMVMQVKLVRQEQLVIMVFMVMMDYKVQMVKDYINQFLLFAC